MEPAQAAQVSFRLLSGDRGSDLGDAFHYPSPVPEVSMGPRQACCSLKGAFSGPTLESGTRWPCRLGGVAVVRRARDGARRGWAASAREPKPGLGRPAMPFT